MEPQYNQVNIEKVSNGFVISKQTVAKNLLGSKALRFDPHIAANEKELLDIVLKLSKNCKSAIEIEKELQKKEDELNEDSED